MGLKVGHNWDMAAKLEVQIGPGYKTFELGESTVIGRDAGCTIPLEDRLISRTHAEIRQLSINSYELVDLGSTHGTFVGDKRISNHNLVSDDIIMIGATRIVFKQDLTESVGVKSIVIEASADVPFVQERIDIKETVFPAFEEHGSPDELKLNYEKLRASYRLSKVMASQADAESLDLLFEGILDAAFDLLAATRGALILIDRETGTPVPRVARNRSGDTAEIVLSSSVINEVLSSKAGLLIADAASDSRFQDAKSIISQAVRSTMCVPLISENEMLGVIHLDSQFATNVFSEKDLDLFNTIARQAAAAIRGAMLRERIRSESKYRVYFQRFLSPSLVKQVMDGDFQLGQEGELTEITVLFSDIRGFTKMSEGMTPGEVVAMLNDHYERMVDILFKYGGTFDKYVGDELMAFFGAPAPQKDSATLAVRCAIEMQDVNAEENKKREAAGVNPIYCGIGVHTGLAVTGAIGSPKTRQYTAIGDSVNTGARLCSLAGNGEVIISQATSEELVGTPRMEELEPQKVKGKKEPLIVYRISAIDR